MSFRDVSERRGLLLSGPSGWGEFSPFPDYGPQLTSRCRAAALEAATGTWPVPVRERVAVNAVVPAVAPQSAHDIAVASGCSTVKIKVGDDGDEARVEAVRDALGPRGRVRLDANGAWSLETALRRIARLQRFDLEYIEQPVATLDEMARLRRLVSVPLAVDECLRLAPDPLHVGGLLDAADLIVLKVQPLGGVRACMRVAEAAGLPAVVSSAVETSVGLSAGLALAAALPSLPFACGLGTASLLARDVVATPLVPVGGFLDVRRPPVDERLLAACELSGDERAAELARFEAAGAAA